MEDKASKEVAEPKRAQILDAALEVFVVNGYVGTSTDQLAAAAAVSKQTLYRAFGDKQGIFAALIRSVCDRVNDPFEPLIEKMDDAADGESAVRMLADRFGALILSPQTQRVRRLVIAEATRFPELGRVYWEKGFERMLSSVGRCLEVLDARGLLSIPEPLLAAQHFAGLLLWVPGNEAMFLGEGASLDAERVRTLSDAGAKAFLRAYAVRA